MSDWTIQRIEQMAPDAASLKAAQGLAKPAKWQGLGRNESSIWGECQGSGANPYQVRVDLVDAAYKCSCPSRKLPCKHTLGLLLLLSAKQLTLQAEPPAFLIEWQSNRSKRAEAKQAKAESTGTTPDPVARAKRQQKRESRITEGLTQLENWLGDVINQGIVSARSQPAVFWTQMASRLVDAQAPGLARRVRTLGDRIVATKRWQSLALEELAKLQLLIDAYRNLDALPFELAAEVRTQTGWTQERESLSAREGLRDNWMVVGRYQLAEENLRVQCTWLMGLQLKRFALILEFAVGNQPLPASFTVGQVIDSELVYFDGCPAIRAIEKHRHALLSHATSLSAPDDIASMQHGYVDALSQNPWLDRWPVMIRSLTPVIRKEELWFADSQQRMIPAIEGFRYAWQVFALAGSATLNVFGEWDGVCLTPLTFERHGQLFTLANIGEVPVLAKVA